MADRAPESPRVPMTTSRGARSATYSTIAWATGPSLRGVTAERDGVDREARRGAGQRLPRVHDLGVAGAELTRGDLDCVSRVLRPVVGDDDAVVGDAHGAP